MHDKSEAIRLMLSGTSDESEAATDRGVIIQVTQAFCPLGHNVVDASRGTFQDQPGIGLYVSDGVSSGEVVLSPFHGDPSRLGFIQFREGSRLTLACPVCQVRLPLLSRCSCQLGELHVLYLTPKLDRGHVIALCDVWGCHRSKVIDQAQLLKTYGEEDESLEGNSEEVFH